MTKLKIIPTPIGNLEDITLRALKELQNANIILSEDTRTTGILLKHYDINTPLKAYHKYNEHKSLGRYTNWIQQCTSHAALVSDAGTPSISDPGFLLVRECIQQGIEVECLPGATALIPALVVSGLPSDHFCFDGFLPHKKGRQKKWLGIKEETRTTVLYESCHRVEKLISEMQIHLNADRQVALIKELSKIHETIIRGRVAEMPELIKAANLKGEFVVVIEGCKR